MRDIALGKREYLRVDCLTDGHYFNTICDFSFKDDVIFVHNGMTYVNLIVNGVIKMPTAVEQIKQRAREEFGIEVEYEEGK